jgi:hypothetical protein
VRKDILDPGPAVSGPEKEVGPGVVKGEFDRGWPSKWVGPDQLEDSALPQETLDIIARLDEGGVEGLLLPAVQKVAPAENMPFTFYKITDQDSRDTLAEMADEGLFDDLDNVVFLDPGGGQGAAGMFIKIEGVKGEAQDEQDMGAWSPLSDFSDSDVFF